MTDPRSIAIAERIRLARRLAGLSQEETAAKLGIAVRTFTRWERCETLGFLNELKRIAEALGTTVEELAPPELDPGSGSLEEKVDRLLVEVSSIRRHLGLTL